MNSWKVILVEQGHPHYDSAFKLAQAVYKNAFGASLQKPSPGYFVYLESEDSQEMVKACMSGTPIRNGTKLFSERYLDYPVEHYVSTPTAREKILEIGSFSSLGDPFSTRQLMIFSTFIGYMVHNSIFAAFQAA